MADEVVRFPNLTGRTFSAEHQPSAAQRSAGHEKQRATASVKHALMNAFDKLGNEAFFVELGRGSAEDKRCLAMILAKLLPIEVQGALDASLKVVVVTQAQLLQDAEPTPALPVAPDEEPRS